MKAKVLNSAIYEKCISLKSDFEVSDTILKYSDENTKVSIFKKLENGQPRYSMKIDRNGKTTELSGTTARKCWHGILRVDSVRGRGRPTETYDYSDDSLNDLIMDLK